MDEDWVRYQCHEYCYQLVSLAVDDGALHTSRRLSEKCKKLVAANAYRISVIKGCVERYTRKHGNSQVATATPVTAAAAAPGTNTVTQSRARNDHCFSSFKQPNNIILFHQIRKLQLESNLPTLELLSALHEIDGHLNSSDDMNFLCSLLTEKEGGLAPLVGGVLHYDGAVRAVVCRIVDKLLQNAATAQAVSAMNAMLWTVYTKIR